MMRVGRALAVGWGPAGGVLCVVPMVCYSWRLSPGEAHQRHHTRTQGLLCCVVQFVSGTVCSR
jgi:hypothetical protein